MVRMGIGPHWPSTVTADDYGAWPIRGTGLPVDLRSKCLSDCAGSGRTLDKSSEDLPTGRHKTRRGSHFPRPPFARVSSVDRTRKEVKPDSAVRSGTDQAILP